MLLEVKDLDISYGDKLTVTGASLELDKGEIMSIVGESGSGKTTVIRAIMGCLPGAGRVSRGSIIFDGKDVLQNTPDEWRKMYGSEMSMIFQDSGNMINPIRRIGQQFIDYVQAHQPDKSKDQAYKMCCDMLTNVRLPNPENIMNSYPFELSGGMRQRVGIAMAMIFSPKILLADEPTSALDVTTPAHERTKLVLEINHLTKKFAVDGGKFLTACNDINLRAYEGRTLGIIGESGCGKSTLVRTLLRIHPATSGEAIFEGHDLMQSKGEQLRQDRKNIQMVFQDPTAAFNPKMLVKDILTEPLKNFGLIKNSEVDAKAAELLEMVELPAEFKDRYPHSMSGGQRQRLGIARALALEPKIIVCDEATSALDVSVQEKICELLCRIQKEKNITYLFIAHDLGLVDLMCHQVAVMYLGNVVEWLEHGRIAEQCKHPYTKALMGAVFKVDFKPGEKIEPLEGEIPSPLDLPPGCPFASRCEHCTEHCVQVKPELKEVEHGHWVACHLFD